MYHNSVHRYLLEIFPQVDIRLLKAVAIEYSKDADAAVECVLFKILPLLPSSSNSHHVLPDSQDVIHSPVQQVVTEEPELQRIVGGASAGLPSNSGYVDDEDHNCLINTTDAPYVGSECLGELPVGSSNVSPPGGSGDDLQTSTCGSALLDQTSHRQSLNAETEELNSLEWNQNVNFTHGSDHVGYGSLTQADLSTEWMNVWSVNTIDLNELAVFSNSTMCGAILPAPSCLDGDSSEMEKLLTTGQLIPSSQEETFYSTECGSLSPKVSDTLNDFERSHPRNPSGNLSAEEVFGIEVGHVENGSSSIAMVSDSSHICSIDHLEESIEEAKNRKDTLILAMHSVINKMKELELQEEAAEQAKREAAMCGPDILTKVEDLRQILKHAKEANDMHSGEVYGEKAILATEVREFQSRIQSLSEDRDKSLAILEEMKQTLGKRIAAAEEEIQMAKQEKLEKENLAKMALAEQELAMEKVVEESKRLQQQAEENSKLRDFLVDRGRVIDILQGEIAVICQDVKFLKENFDENAPVSKSLSAKQTSCILATSSSSTKILGYDQVLESVNASEAMEETCSSPSVLGKVQKSSNSEEKIHLAPFFASGDSKIPLDDEWELLMMSSD